MAEAWSNQAKAIEMVEGNPHLTDEAKARAIESIQARATHKRYEPTSLDAGSTAKQTNDRLPSGEGVDPRGLGHPRAGVGFRNF